MRVKKQFPGLPCQYLIGICIVVVLTSTFSSMLYSAVAPKKEAKPAFLFAAVGDYGTDTVAAFKVAELVKSWNPKFVVSLGDNDYNHARVDYLSSLAQHVTPLYGEYVQTAESEQKFNPSTTANRFWPTIGNHDRDSGSIEYYLDFFDLPNNERYYDVWLGDVHLFVINGADEPDGVDVQSTQARWIKEKMMASSAPWKLVLVHFPPYSSGIHGGTGYLRWPFSKWGATAVLAGHDHTYERLHIAGIPYFVNGAGGARMYNFGAIDKSSVFRYNKMNGAMKIFGNSAAITFSFVNAEGIEIDRVTIDNGKFNSIIEPTSADMNFQPESVPTNML